MTGPDWSSFETWAQLYCVVSAAYALAKGVDFWSRRDELLSHVPPSPLIGWVFPITLVVTSLLVGVLWPLFLTVDGLAWVFQRLGWIDDEEDAHDDEEESV